MSTVYSSVRYIKKNNKIHFSSATCPPFGCCPLAHGAYQFEGITTGFRYDERWPFETVVQFSCLPHWQINGTSRITCTAAGTWSHETPTCVWGKALVFVF